MVHYKNFAAFCVLAAMNPTRRIPTGDFPQYYPFAHPLPLSPTVGNPMAPFAAEVELLCS